MEIFILKVAVIAFGLSNLATTTLLILEKKRESRKYEIFKFMRGDSTQEMPSSKTQVKPAEIKKKSQIPFSPRILEASPEKLIEKEVGLTQMKRQWEGRMFPSSPEQVLSKEMDEMTREFMWDAYMDYQRHSQDPF